VALLCLVLQIWSDWSHISAKTNLHKNSQAAKKSVARAKMTVWKKLWNQSSDGRIMAKFLITTIQANLCCLLQASLGIGNKFTWIVIKNFAIILPSQPLLSHHLWFQNFCRFCMGTPFLQFGCFCVDFTSFCNLAW